MKKNKSENTKTNSTDAKNSQNNQINLNFNQYTPGSLISFLDPKASLTNEQNNVIKLPILEEETSDVEKKEQILRKKTKMSKKSQSEQKEHQFPFHNEDDSKTIFLGNVPIDTQNKELKKLFSSCGHIQSIRFRSIAFNSGSKLPKKVNYITKNLEKSRQSMNAYIRFDSEDSVKNAIKMNGILFKDNHLHVDTAAKKVFDHRKTVFVGNLPFVIEEEDLIKHFTPCGEIEQVRIVRDHQTNKGKGFAYVVFQNINSIPTALAFHNTGFKGRLIRILKCQSMTIQSVKKRKRNKNFKKTKNQSRKKRKT